jgi:4-cresol dehydrogenase (hydroxylating)
VLFSAPSVPFTGRDVARAVKLAERAMRAHGFDPILAIRATQGPRALVVLAFITWDREVKADDARALACYSDLSDTLAAAGYHAYRDVGPATVARPKTSAAHRALTRRIKNALDPRGILAPGRYEF